MLCLGRAILKESKILLIDEDRYLNHYLIISKNYAFCITAFLYLKYKRVYILHITSASEVLSSIFSYWIIWKGHSKCWLQHRCVHSGTSSRTFQRCNCFNNRSSNQYNYLFRQNYDSGQRKTNWIRFTSCTYSGKNLVITNLLRISIHWVLFNPI